MAASASSAMQFQSSFKRRLGSKKSANSQRPSVDMPECLRGEEDDDIDATGAFDAMGPAQVQQSLYGFIRAAGGQFGAVFESGIASDSENDTEFEDEGKDIFDSARNPSEATGDLSSLEDQRGNSQLKPLPHRKGKPLAQMLMKPIRESNEVHSDDTMSQSQFLPPRETTRDALELPANSLDVHKQDAAVDRILQPEANMAMENSQTSLVQKRSKEQLCNDSSRDNKKQLSRLPVAVADIFGFDDLEQTVIEYPCWFLQNVLVEGYIYITNKHVCFYAYLPKKRSTAIKSGSLSKQGKRNPRYRRYWFELKGDVLSYFASAADPYFPRGAIDLRYGISAELDQEKGVPTTAFTVTTQSGTYHFKAESAPSAKEWVKQLQKVIFRSRNDGDSVKIVLPVVNIVDAESTGMMGRQDTIRLRVIDNAETYAVDEYFFTFLKHGQAALDTINGLIENNSLREVANPAGRGVSEQGIPDSMAIPSSKGYQSTNEISDWFPGHVPPSASSMRSTVSRQTFGSTGGPKPRSSDEFDRPSEERSRASIGRKCLNTDQGRQIPKLADRGNWYGAQQTSKPTPSSSTEESSESFTSSDHVEAPTGCIQADMSASQILGGDKMFQSPTIRASQHHLSVPPSHQSPVSDLSIPKSSTCMLTDQDLSIGIQRARDPRSIQVSRRTSLPPLGGMSMRILATPLQQAFNLYDNMRNQSKRGLSYLSGSPKEYYSKFSEAIAGGQKHYSDLNGLPEDRIDDPEQDLDASEHQRRFQEHFALPKSERLLAVFYCWLHRVLPLYGKIYIGEHFFCFRSLIYGTRTKLKVAFKNMLNVEKEKGFRWKFPGMVVALRGREELFFDFTSNGLRDDCVVSVLRCLDNVSLVQSSVLLTEDERKDAQKAAAENERLEMARKDFNSKFNMPSSAKLDGFETESQSILFDDTEASVLDFKPTKPLRITCLTIGSRGDVQPYIALCKGLIADGHKVRIATHHEFGPWVKQYGIDFVPVDGDPAELMRLCVENGMFTPSFIFEVNFKFRGWLDKLLNSSYEACKGSDLLIDSPSTMGGIHIAEALGIPYFRAFTMPWTRTRAYPHAFAVPGHKRGGGYNYMTYMMFDNLFWQITAGQINRWRRKTLGLKPTSLEKLQANKVPFLYNFSPSVVVPPLDFSDWIRITGYWFLDEGEQYVPPADLVAFIDKAHEDKAKLVYIGFGSITVSDSKVLTQQVVGAVRKAGVRCILSKGWSDRLSQNKQDPSALEVPLPSEIFQIKSVPHDWLFRQVDACVHHGGAGTTGASLRAGKPTVIKPFFGDQHFFATRVEDLGVGIRLEGITVNSLGRAIWNATHEMRMREKARALGEQIRREDGVGTAIKAIYRDLEYAKTLIKRRDLYTADEDADTENAEEWVYVENNVDIDLTST